jgi:hypothetical protein
MGFVVHIFVSPVLILFRSEFFFRTTQELEYLFFCRAKRNFFLQNSTLRYMTKTLNQIIFVLLFKALVYFVVFYLFT